MANRSERFEFSNQAGDSLAGRLELPSGNPKAVAIFAHCFTCSKNVAAATKISRELCSLGIAVLRFDFTGLGNSDGDFQNTNFSSNVEDVISAAQALQQRALNVEILIGHSLGGAAVLSAASKLEDVKLVATIGAPSEPKHVVHLFEEQRPEIESQGLAEVSLAGRKFTIKQQFVDDVTTTSLKSQIAALRKVLVLFHSPVDDIVNVENAREIYEAAMHPKSYISLDQADHLLTKPKDAAFVARTLAAYTSHYLEADTSADESKVPEGEVRVVELGTNYALQIQAGEHLLTADEPASHGGQNTGPAPYDLLLAALGACKTMTTRMYADRKAWPVEKISASLQHEKVSAENSDDSAAPDGKVSRIDVQLTFEGDLDDSQRERLLEIADKCPVHRTLSSKNQITSRIDET